MAGLQRSAVSFRRQGSSGLVWDDRFLSGELNKLNNNSSNEDKESNQQQQQQQKELNNKGLIATVRRSRSSNGGYRTAGRAVSPAIEPPSPKLSACGFCGAFGRKTNSKGQRSKGLNNNDKHHHRSR